MTEKQRSTQSKGTGKMTVREAGHLGGQKVHDLIEKGEKMEQKKGGHAA
ncbi:MAG: hypothetical protein ACYDBB_25315 [Armatimonadota bacterium]